MVDDLFPHDQLTIPRYNEEVCDLGNIGAICSLDLGTYRNFFGVLTANTTIVITNPPPPGRMVPITLELSQDGTGSRTVTFPSAWKWPSGTTPTVTSTAAAVDVYTGYTRNSGVTYRMVQAAKDVK